MKRILFLFAILVSFQYSSTAQNFSRSVMPFIEVQDSVVLIKNVKIIDGTGGSAKVGQDVLLVNNRIEFIGKSSENKYGGEKREIDGTGKTLIPGLIMMHEHLFHAKPFFGSFKAVHMANTFPQMYLAGGVTTMRTAGSLEASSDLNVKNLISKGLRIGPDIDVSTPHVEREGLENFIPQLQSLYGDESIENWLNYWFDKGVTSVKVYNNLTKDDLQKIVRISHAKNMKVTGHLCSITYQEAAELGIDNLEHSFAVSTDFVESKKENECVYSGESMRQLDIDDPKLVALMNLLIEKDVTLTYTPTVFEPYTNREALPGGADASVAPYLLEKLQERHQSVSNSMGDSLSLIGFNKEMERVMKFHSMGGKITVGTDPTGAGKTIAGYSNQRMIELLIETGFSIEEAIKIATLNGAEYLGIQKETGSIEVGKAGDFVLIDGDLTKDVSNIRKMQLVFKDGVGYSSRKIFDSVKGKVGAY